MMARKPADYVPYTLRFREELRHRLERAAKKNNTSLNAEVINRLEKSFQAEDLVTTVKATLQASFVEAGLIEVNGGKGK